MLRAKPMNGLLIVSSILFDHRFCHPQVDFLTFKAALCRIGPV
jgi:hypothetical protein